MAGEDETKFIPLFALVAVGDFNGAVVPVVADLTNDGWVEPLGFINNDGTLTVNTGPDNYYSVITSFPDRANRNNLVADLFGKGTDDVLANVYTLPSETASRYLFFTTDANDEFTEDSNAIPDDLGGYGETMVAADFFNNGLLDVFGPRYTFDNHGNDNYFLANNGNGTFTDEGATIGVGMPNTPEYFRPEGAEAIDLYKTGWIDLYVGGNLYLNQDGTFTNISAQVGLGPMFDEGAMFADLDDNGYEDSILKVPGLGIRIYWGGPNGFSAPTDLTQAVVASGNEGGLGQDGLNAYDILGNGYEDIITSTADGVGIFWNYGNGDFVYEPLGQDVGVGNLFAFGDFENNYNIDIVAEINGDLNILNSTVNAPTTAFNVTLLDANGLQDEQGRTFTITPRSESGVQLTGVVDGGSGYMSEDQYTVLMHAPWAGLNEIAVYFTAAPAIAWAAGTANITAYANGNFVLAGTTVDNVFIGGHGENTFSGGGGVNTIEGVGNSNTVVFTGAHTDYGVVLLSNGALQITDLRSGSPDGVNTVIYVQSFQFSDETLTQQQMRALAQTAGVSFTFASPYYGELYVNENTNIALGGFVNIGGSSTISDTLSVALSVGDGVLTYNGTSASSLTLSGTAATINQDLASTTYKGNGDFYGTDLLSVKATDKTKPPGLAGVTAVAPVMVEDTASLTNSAPAQYISNTGSSLTLSGITLADSANPNDTLTLRIWVDDGTVTADGQSGLEVDLTGTAAQLNTMLASATYTSSTGFEGTDTLAFTTEDPSGAESAATTVPINVFDTTVVQDSAATVNAGGLNGGGADALVVTTSGSLDLSGVTNFPTINFALGGNSATVTDSTLAGLASLTITGGTGNNSINASGDTSASVGANLSYVAGPGMDTFAGGFENDTVYASASAINQDPLHAGSGTNNLVITTNGSIDLANVSGFGEIQLDDGGNNATLTDATFAGLSQIEIMGGYDDNTINASGDTAASKGKLLIFVEGTQVDDFTGGYETDVIYVTNFAMQYETLKGGSATNSLGISGQGAADMAGVSSFTYINFNPDGNDISIGDSNFAGLPELIVTTNGGTSDITTTDTSASSGKLLYIYGMNGLTDFAGGSEEDIVYVTSSDMQNETVTGGSNRGNSIGISGGGTADLAGVSSFTYINFDPRGNDVTIGDPNLAGLSKILVFTNGGTSDITVSDTSASARKTLYIYGMDGDTSFTGGSERDVVYVTNYDMANETVTGGSSGGNSLGISGGGSADLAGIGGFTFINFDSRGNDVTIGDSNFAGLPEIVISTNGGTSGITSADTSTSAGKSLYVYAELGTMTFDGGFENDAVFAAAASVGNDTLQGGSGLNSLYLVGSGSAGLSGVSGFTFINLDPGGNSITLTKANFAGLSELVVDANGGTNAVAVSDTAANISETLWVHAEQGTMDFTGGFENDSALVATASVGSDTLQGGSGLNSLYLVGSGSANLSGVSGFTFINLDAGGNTITLTDDNFAGLDAIVVDTNGGTNDVAMSDTPDDDDSQVETLYFEGQEGTSTFVGGSENDYVVFGTGSITATAGSGIDAYLFTTPPTVTTDTIVDFTHGVDQIVFDGSNFDLGVDNGTGTTSPQRISASLLSSNTNGTLATTGNRFGYNQQTGALYYGQQGSGGSEQLVATLSGHPTLTASDLYFVS